MYMVKWSIDSKQAWILEKKREKKKSQFSAQVTNAQMVRSDQVAQQRILVCLFILPSFLRVFTMTMLQCVLPFNIKEYFSYLNNHQINRFSVVVLSSEKHLSFSFCTSWTPTTQYLDQWRSINDEGHGCCETNSKLSSHFWPRFTQKYLILSQLMVLPINQLTGHKEQKTEIL